MTTKFSIWWAAKTLIIQTLLRRSKRTSALKQATRSVSKSCHTAGFTLRYPPVIQNTFPEF